MAKSTAPQKPMGQTAPIIQYPLLAACGLYCGACYHYRAAFPQSRHLLEQAVRQGRQVEGYTCRGCRSDALYIHLGCAQCEIRDCVDAKGLLHCGQCPERPCVRLQAFHQDGHVHHLSIFQQLDDLAQKGPAQWLAEQKQKWTCTCGSPYSWYEKTCRQCGRTLPSSYPPASG